jgi:ubiquinone/menaquinone biosynthesis C-methylase UbiE
MPKALNHVSYAVLCALIVIPASHAQEQKSAVSGKAAETVVTVKSRASLIHLGSLDSFDVTDGGKQAAKHALEFLETGERRAAQQAIDIWDHIIPDENFGGEYTALRWVLQCQLATEAERKTVFLADPLVESFHRKLSGENWKALKGYLIDKYHLREMPKERIDMIELKRLNRFLEDFILFANPRREQWEKSSLMIDAMGVKPGDKVADIGSGPGFFSFAFGKLVGPAGKVYAVDNNEDHIGYLKDTISRLKIANVEPIMPKVEDMGIPEKVDLVYMCSLYHNIYSMFSDTEREAMVEGMKRALKPDGRLILTDNGPVEGRLPYHGPYIARELIIQQLQFYGFDLVETHQFIPQRYMLTFKLRPGMPALDRSELLRRPEPVPEGGIVARSLAALPPTHGVAELLDGTPDKLHILSRRSLIHSHIPGIAHTYSTKGRAVAEVMLDALMKNDREKIAEADRAYDKIIPTDRIGDDYTALQWFCRYILAPDSEKPGFITEPIVRDYFDFFAADDYKRLKLYLKNKYVIGELKQKFEELASRDEEKDKQELEALKKADTPEARAMIAKRPAPLNAEGGPGAKPPMPSTEIPLAKNRNPDGNNASTPTIADTKVASPGGSESAPGPTSMPLPRPPKSTSQPVLEEGLEPPPPPYQALPLDVDVGELISWWEYMNFCNPRREEWEKTSKMLDFIGIKPGDSVADVGSGGGYLTMKFAKLVGNGGKVFALDLVQSQLDNLKRGAQKAGFSNIAPILSTEDDTTLPPDSVDVAVLCSLYHAIYVHSMEYVKDRFVHSLKRSIKPGGKLVIIDNEPLSDHAGGYYGPHMAKELIISQLAQYGFKFNSFAQFVPQRYILVFEVEK